jgi:hypothetical protein
VVTCSDLDVVEVLGDHQAKGGRFAEISFVRETAQTLAERGWHA